MKNFILNVKSNVNNKADSKFCEIEMLLRTHIDGRIIDTADMALFTSYLNSLIELPEINRVVFMKNSDREYEWFIMFNPRRFYFVRITSQRVEDNLHVSMLSDITTALSKFGMFPPLGLNYNAEIKEIHG